jgi:hypothetical protein
LRLIFLMLIASDRGIRISPFSLESSGDIFTQDCYDDDPIFAVCPFTFPRDR